MSKSDPYANSPNNIELTKLSGTGEAPGWLQGKLVRNGPALFQLDKTNLKHWFDGYGMLHGFLFKEGELYYQSRYTESKEYLNARSSGKVETVAWGTASDPCRSMFRRFMSNFSAIPDNTNVNVIKIGEKYFTTSDIATINQFDVESLETLSNFNGSKGGVIAAHPSYTTDSKVWNMSSKFGPVIKNTIVSVDDQPSTTSYASFQTKKLYYFHSFGNTERYFISIDQPMQLNFVDLITSGIKNKSFYECFSWNNTAKNIFHIYDRQENKMMSLTSEMSFFFFHTVNTFTEDDKIILDLCGYRDNSIVDDFYLDNLASKGIADEHKATLRRITIDLKTMRADQTDLEINVELPNINDAYRDKTYRYIYGVHSPKGDARLAVKIIKYDLNTNTNIMWDKPSYSVGEPIFVANPSAKTEDDGVLLVVCYPDNSGPAELTILDAVKLNVVATMSYPSRFHQHFTVGSMVLNQLIKELICKKH